MRKTVLTVLILSGIIGTTKADWTVIVGGDPLTIANNGILVKASNFGSGALPQTINGITYDTNYSNISGASATSDAWASKFYSGPDPAISNLLNTGGRVRENALGGPSTMTFTFSGLTIGNQYRFQLFLGNGGNSGNLYGNDWSEYKYVYFNNDTPRLAIYTWTADATQRIIRTNAGVGQGTHYNLAYALHDITTLSPDVSLDRFVDNEDYEKIAQWWLKSCQAGSWCGQTDLNQSGQVEIGDITILAENWLSSTINGLAAWWKLDEGTGTIVKDKFGVNGGITCNMETNDWNSIGQGDYVIGIDSQTESDKRGEYIRLPRAVQNDFTISFWARTTNSSDSDADWWTGKGLVATSASYEAYYAFDEKTGTVANDSSPCVRNGTLVNDPTWQTDSGERASVLSFDGINNYVNVSGYKGITGTSNRTCAAWIKTGATAGPERPIVAWGAGTIGNRWCVRLKEDATFGVSVYGGNISTVQTYNDGAWHHVAAALSSSGSPRLADINLYVDGVLQTVTISNDPAINTASAGDVIIGSRQEGTPYSYFNGQIDDVRIYAQAIGDNQIAGLAASRASDNDFGISLLGNYAAFGVGTATIKSTKAINDGQWHNISATRNGTSGVIKLYIDGALEATGTGPTGSLNALPLMLVGSMDLRTGEFPTGWFDDIRFYDNVIGVSDIAKLAAKKHPSVTSKKGQAGSTPAENKLKVGWCYNWGRTHSSKPDGVEFVPMQWGKWWPSTATLVSEVTAMKQQGIANYLLGFNEPDSTTQSDTSVATAISLWPLLMQTGLPLVSPGCVHPDNSWMLDFMAQIDSLGYRVDYVAVHWYGGSSTDSLINVLQSVYNLYGRPIWITEFAVADWSASETNPNQYSKEVIYTFMAEILWRLEKLNYLTRYAWFSAAPSLYTALGTSALFNTDGSLTELGQLYSSWDGDVDGPDMETWYFLNHKSSLKRLRTPDGSTVGMNDISYIGTRVQWKLVDAGSSWYYIQNNETGTRLRTDSSGSQLSLVSAANTGNDVQWKFTESSHGWYYVDHKASSKRLYYKDSEGIVKMVTTSTTNDYVKWRFIKP